MNIEICNFNGILYGMFPSDTGGLSGSIVKSEKANEAHSGPILYFYLEYGMSEVTEKILSGGGNTDTVSVIVQCAYGFCPITATLSALYRIIGLISSE